MTTQREWGLLMAMVLVIGSPGCATLPWDTPQEKVATVRTIVQATDTAYVLVLTSSPELLSPKAQVGIEAALRVAISALDEADAHLAVDPNDDAGKVAAWLATAQRAIDEVNRVLADIDALGDSSERAIQSAEDPL